MWSNKAPKVVAAVTKLCKSNGLVVLHNPITHTTQIRCKTVGMNIISYKDAFVEPAYFDPIEEKIEGWIRHEKGSTAIKLLHKEGYIPGTLVRPEIKPFTREQKRSYLLKKLQHLKIEAIKERRELAKLPTETKKRREVPKVEPIITPGLSDIVRRMREEEATSDTHRLQYLQHIGYSDAKPPSVDDEIARVMHELRLTEEPQLELPDPAPLQTDLLIKVRPWRIRGLMNQQQFLGRRYILTLDNGTQYTVIGQHLEVDPQGMHPTGVQLIVWDPRREPARRYNQLPAKGRSYLSLEEQEEENKRAASRKQQDESAQIDAEKKAAGLLPRIRRPLLARTIRRLPLLLARTTRRKNNHRESCS